MSLKQLGGEFHAHEWTLGGTEGQVGPYQATPMTAAQFHAKGDFTRVTIEGSMFEKDEQPVVLEILSQGTPYRDLPSTPLYVRVTIEGDNAVVRMACARPNR